MTKIKVRRGDSLPLRLIVRRDGAPVPLTGCQIWLTAKASIDAPDNEAVFQKQIGSGITVVDEIGGIATIRIEPADTTNLVAPVTLEFDVQVLELSGDVTTVVRGQFELTEDITRAT